METYKLFLDDERLPRDCLKYMGGRIYDVNLYADPNWVIVRNYRDFVRYIKEHGKPILCSFDHDLGTAEGDGYECVVFLVEYCMDNDLQFPTSVVHSGNPVGTENIESLIKNFKKYQNEEFTSRRGE